MIKFRIKYPKFYTSIIADLVTCIFPGESLFFLVCLTQPYKTFTSLLFLNLEFNLHNFAPYLIASSSISSPKSFVSIT